MTLLVRDEADIVGDQIAYHLAAGVDFVIATDHSSSDGSTEILERYAAEGVLHLLRETSPLFRQSEWVTRMARLAATHYGADWVINSDADEFWWPSGGSLRDVLARVPRHYGSARTFVRPFLPPGKEGFFAEEMTVRLVLSAPINDPASTFRPNTRVLHRGAADVTVGAGNTAVRSQTLLPACNWAPVEVLHFPIRGIGHFERKFRSHAETVRQRRRVDHQRVAEAADAGHVRGIFDAIAPDENRLARGLADGSLAIDTRLRDAVRALATERGSALAFPPRDVRANVQYAVEQSALDSGELVRVNRRLDDLHRRLRAVEQRRLLMWSPWKRVRRRPVV